MSKELLKQNIEKAQFEIDRKKDMIKSGKMRQHYHFMPQTGWLNDPNGLIYFRGKYHFFFQHNPYSGFWDSMHWGHAVSDDMLHWEYLPLALVPSEKYDNHQKGGCFSGSAIEHDGKLFLMYTGVTNEGNGYEQVQCIAYSEDGIHFEKYEGNPVLTAPEGIPTDMFRDPKVWKHEDTYYMVCGASRNNRGMALLYRSKNMLNWEFFNVLAERRGEWGFMWECPDFYPIGDKYVLTFSPMGSGDHTSVYLVGDFDYETGSFYSHVSGEINWGFDYYAPQSFESEDGRRIHISWMGMPDCEEYTNLTLEDGWQHCFTFPREVHVKDKKVLQQPVKELEALSRGEERAVSVLEKKGTKVFEAEVQNITGNHFRAVLAKELVLEYVNGRFEMKFTSQDKTSVSAGRSLRFREVSEVRNVRILADVSSVEVFVNDGETVFSTRYYPQDYEIKIEALDAKIAFWEL